MIKRNANSGSGGPWSRRRLRLPSRHGGGQDTSNAWKRRGLGRSSPSTADGSENPWAQRRIRRQPEVASESNDDRVWEGVGAGASLRTKAAAGLAAVAVVLAVVGFVMPSTKPTNTALPTISTSTLAPRTVQTPPEQIIMAPPPTTTTTAPAIAPAPPTAPVRTFTVAATPPAAPPGPCTADDLTVTTTTDAPSYSPGSQVVVTSILHFVHTCVFTPANPPSGTCPAAITIRDSNGNQAWPAKGASVTCADLQGGTFSQGSTQSVTMTWDGNEYSPSTGSTPAPAGAYSATGAWYWSSDGQPLSQSTTFTIS
ncbi:MAG TPA: hypothetical protein VEI83_01475 [Acidimicrobiales bacterium]|nr:hypothetical protein [Acidimicrobiales bacterium]